MVWVSWMCAGLSLFTVAGGIAALWYRHRAEDLTDEKERWKARGDALRAELDAQLRANMENNRRLEGIIQHAHLENRRLHDELAPFVGLADSDPRIRELVRGYVERGLVSSSLSRTPRPTFGGTGNVPKLSATTDRDPVRRKP